MEKEILMDKNTIIVSETNNKGIITFANDDFCKLSGFKLEELIGKPHNIVRHPDMPKAAFKELWDTVQKGKVWKGIVKNKTKNGEFYWVNATAYPSKNSKGETIFISVRIKPTQKEINDAITLYKKLI